jgi:predicted site-specific integrase-resolvase
MATALLLPQETARRLDVSVKTLNGLADDGEIRYVETGRGSKNKRRRYTEEFISEYIERRTRRDVPCPSTSTKTARSTTSISNSKVIGFTAQRERRISEKLKP